MNRWTVRVGHTLASGLVVAIVLVGCGGPTSSSAKVVHNVRVVPGPGDWPTYGHDAQHTFHGRTTLTTAAVKKLKVAWFFPTGDAVTATPTVVGGTIYVGSWDGNFYALNYETGALRWKHQLSAQNAVTPFPGQHPRAVTSDGGLITSSAWYQVGDATRPDLVIFGGGYTLYALNAATGALYWRHDYTGQPGKPPNPNRDGTRIFSSPVVVGDKVLFGTDVDGQNGSRGLVAAASLDTGKPVWEFQTDVNSAGHVLDNGCGSVWSSGSVLPSLGLVVFDTADCNFSNVQNFSDSILALHIDNGHLAWVYRPPLPGIDCDWDFGGSVNAGVVTHGDTTFLGAGSKDGSYYSLNPATGQLRWKTNVVFGGFSGGFIATTAYDGHYVYGSTAVGDFGKFEKGTQILCDPGNPRDTAMQQPTVHAFNAGTGAVTWQADNAASFAPTTVAGGMTFNGPALGVGVLQVRDAATGGLLDSVDLPGPNWSGAATVGNAVITGIGSSYTAQPAGVVAITPGGVHPVTTSTDSATSDISGAG
jgi:outer membrane protein assembly factor BamB